MNETNLRTYDFQGGQFGAFVVAGQVHDESYLSDSFLSNYSSSWWHILFLRNSKVLVFSSVL